MSTFREKFINILRSFKAYRSFSYVPKGSIQLTQLHHLNFIVLKEYPPVQRTAPFTIDKNIYWKFTGMLRDTPQKTFVIEEDNWSVWGNQGAVVTNDELLLADVSREFEKPGHSIFMQPRLVPPVVLKGTSAIINASGADMYYHWMVDILPRVSLLRNCGFTDDKIDQYIVDYRDIPYQTETLAALAIDQQKISRANDHFSYHIVAEHLVVPSLASKLDVVSAEACRFLRDSFLKEGSASLFGKKIYLKRTGKRKLTNNADIEAYLEGVGFDVVECEKLTVAEQVALFNNADIIAGPHGAAFTNIVFCKPGTKVIEFYSPKWINPCYWTIANEISLNYYYLVGEGAPPAVISDAKGTTADITLSLDKLEQLFNKFSILN